MNQYVDQIISRTHTLMLRFVVALVFATQLTVQQCNPNDIRPFPRVLGVSATYPTTSNQMDSNELHSQLVMVGGTNYLSPINQVIPSYSLIPVPNSLPYIVFYEGFNLPLKWSRSVNHTAYTYYFVSINPSGSHVVGIASAGAT